MFVTLSRQVPLLVGLNRTIEYFKKELEKSKKSKLIDLQRLEKILALYSQKELLAVVFSREISQLWRDDEVNHTDRDFRKVM